jgi:hypothetical protein
MIATFGFDEFSVLVKYCIANNGFFMVKRLLVVFYNQSQSNRIISFVFSEFSPTLSPNYNSHKKLGVQL